jgi:hypothetical protein
VIVVDGRIDGVWRFERKGTRIAIEIEPFAGAPKASVRRGLESEAERVAAFLGGALDLTWTG